MDAWGSDWCLMLREALVRRHPTTPRPSRVRTLSNPSGTLSRAPPRKPPQRVALTCSPKVESAEPISHPKGHPPNVVTMQGPV